MRRVNRRFCMRSVRFHRSIARKAAVARWSGEIPKSINEGILKIGDIEIECAVLEGGTRVINQESFLRAIGRSRSPKAGTGSASVEVDDMPPFLAADNLKQFITPELQQSTTPILYRPVTGAPRAYGYNALLLPQVCDVYLRLKKVRVLDRAGALDARPLLRKRPKR